MTIAVIVNQIFHLKSFIIENPSNSEAVLQIVVSDRPALEAERGALHGLQQARTARLLYVGGGVHGQPGRPGPHGVTAGRHLAMNQPGVLCRYFQKPSKF